MKYLKKFETQQQYEAFISVMVKPNVSLIEDAGSSDNKMVYNPFINTTGVTLNTNTLSFVGTGSTQTLTATVLPNDATDKTVTWSTSDDTIATVSNGGVVTAVNYGNAIITVTTTDGGFTAQCGVNIAKNQGQVTTAPTAVTGLTYDSTAQALVTAGVGTGTMLYKLDDGEWGDGIPTATNAGDYVVTYKASASTDYTESTTGSVSVSIAKVTPTVVAPTAKVLTYNGSAQALVTAGSTNWGTLKYSLDDSTYSTSIPSGTNAISYTVYYKVEGDSNVNDVAAQTINVSIAKASGSVTTVPTAKSLTYNGSTQALVNAGSGTGTMMYKLDNGSWVTSIPTATNATSYTVYYKAAESTNYNESTSGSVSCSIAKANRTLSWTSSPSSVDSGSTITVAATPSAGSGDGSITYSSSNSNVASVNGSTISGRSIGSCTITATISQGANYNAASTSYTLTVDYPFVDIGGIKWAKKNVGATGVTDYGNYYQYGKGADQYASTSGQSGYSGREDPLAANADTATQVWGGQWHMPTEAQLNELIANTNYSWTTNYQGSGINGGLFTDKTDSSKKLFFPAAGGWSDGSQSSVGSYGLYWSSTPYGSNSAYLFLFSSRYKEVLSNIRSEGYPVRPVIG